MGNSAGSQEIDLMDIPVDAEGVLRAYQSIRGFLPCAGPRRETLSLEDLSTLTERYDLFLFDAFGVLNVGDRIVQGAPERVQALREAGKQVLMVSNAASFPANKLAEKYVQMGLPFTEELMICSREVLLEHWCKWGGARVGLMAPERVERDDLPRPHHMLLDDWRAYEDADLFVLLGSANWSSERQHMLKSSLERRMRPVWVANPDLVASERTWI